MVKVAIIGAGPSGLAQLRAFQAAEKKGQQIPEIVCFEKQEDWGGLWNYTWRTGTDQYGELVHCSMYRYLWSNGPKQCIEFPDYPYTEHFGKAIGSYPPRAVMYDYICGRLKKSHFKNKIRFRTPVRWVKFDDKTQKFTVESHDLKKDITNTQEFDYVVVANGHFSVPNVPQFEGFSNFGGRILHSHDFRDALEFKGKDILIVGTSYSAEDIASQCYKYGCGKVYMSYHRNPPKNFKWPQSFKVVPILTKVEPDGTVHFKDGSKGKVDAIILCTGYLYSFPFLDQELKLHSKNRLWPLSIYKGIFWQKNPKLMYLGMQDQFYTFNMFDTQAWLSRDYILGKYKLPDYETMTKHSSQWRAREQNLVTDRDMVWFQGDYMKQLISETDFPKFAIDEINQLFLVWQQHKLQNIMGYRDNAYRSLIDGTMATSHHTPWIDAKQDSYESYLNQKKKQEIKQ